MDFENYSTSQYPVDPGGNHHCSLHGYRAAVKTAWVFQSARWAGPATCFVFFCSNVLCISMYFNGGLHSQVPIELTVSCSRTFLGAVENPICKDSQAFLFSKHVKTQDWISFQCRVSTKSTRISKLFLTSLETCKVEIRKKHYFLTWICLRNP